MSATSAQSTYAPQSSLCGTVLLVITTHPFVIASTVCAQVAVENQTHAGIGRAALDAHLAAFDERVGRGDEVQAHAVPDPGEYRHRDLQDGTAEVRAQTVFVCSARLP